ncbi:(S)-benzoin forming benzil reductase [Bacillus sp. B15-48]|uniref:(S)-benzoin forming benzil reductase n=1 Tax=Bacillus sp. B15-48 TaxID=1548601 RepID=UPI00193F923F|nr:(S)-benzoin forming benzil reductase [Bacillus sp. B15-48]MBM4760777.1 (S)-benzoin forming benzil reductase [Bacillus sp. B15-48]
MKYAIVTGASKGLGEGIAKQLLAEKINIVGISRNDNRELKKLTEKVGTEYHFFPCNLNSTSEILEVLPRVAEVVFAQQPEIVYLINNTGVIEPIAIVSELNVAEVEQSIQVNLTAPILITNYFLNEVKNSVTPLIIANITSGAAERPVHGWSMYCSTKAAINSFTMTTALEMNNRQSEQKIIAFSPGIMDTEMQETIRSATEASFADLDTFRSYKETGLLRSPEQVAAAFMNLLLHKEIESGKIYYLKDLL